jgi:meso-butanediol dehydrogenase/(S,S)-butanediol dehydrogenase/diacetyl reductase
MGMYKDLEGKRIVVTGGASGIGLATAQRFKSEGSRVFLIDWDEEALKKTLADNKEFVGGVFGDVSLQEDVQKAFKRVDDVMEGLDVLVSNAGISFRKSFDEMEYEQWSKVLKVNLDGMFFCAQQAVIRMKAQKSGVLLFTASTNGLEGHPLYADYNASKAGVILLAKTLALEFAPWLRANAVCPGYVLTPMQKLEYTPEMLEEISANIPLKRQALPEEVAGLFAFLASKEAAFITGQAIAIDGGETAGLS